MTRAEMVDWTADFIQRSCESGETFDYMADRILAKFDSEHGIAYEEDED